MAKILSDTTKFQTLTELIHKFYTKIEEKIHHLLSKLKKGKCINETTYSNLYISSSGPILAGYNQASYKNSKFLAHILAPLTTNKYTGTNSKYFARIISK